MGIAVSDEGKMFARGLGNVERGKNEVKQIKDLLEKYHIEKIIFGLPLKLNGSISRQTEKTISFISKLKQEIALPFIPWDERLSSKQAETILLEADLSRKKRKKLIDKLSAQIILQNYLDSEKPINSDEYE